jgi:DNA-binding transcriptional MerR regulator
VSENLRKLDDEDYPSVTVGQAAELLGVQPAFLRSLDVTGVLHPHRTAGGHRRYSRRQLVLAARLRQLLDDGHSLASAHTISALEDRLRVSDALRQRTDDALATTRADLHERTAELERTQAALDDARDEVTDLHRRLADNAADDPPA